MWGTYLPPPLSTDPFMLHLCNLHEGRYLYTADLLALERRAGHGSQPVPSILQICTPLRLQSWRELLASYPDEAFAAFLLRGIKFGFRIGIPPDFQCKPRPRNLRSALEHPVVV
jgi:hypothetical protein